MTVTPPRNLEPAPFRVLVTQGWSAWEIIDMGTCRDGREILTLRDPFTQRVITGQRFMPHEGEWIARDLDAAMAFARLVGKELL